MNDIVTAKLTIINELGLHARAATLLVQLASQYTSDFFVIKDGRKINGKSIMGVLLLTASKGTEIEIYAQGLDSGELIQAVTELVENKFGEGK